MGMDQTIYLGIYLSCTKKESPQEILDSYKCKNNHVFKEKMNFCPKCGAPLIDVNKTRIIYSPDWYDISEKYTWQNHYLKRILMKMPSGIEDPEEEDILLPNGNPLNNWGHFYDSQSWGTFELNLNSAKLIEDFKKEFADLITTLINIYSVVNVHFGFISYWS